VTVFGRLDRRAVVLAVALALLVGGLVIAVEAIVTDHDKSAAKTRVRDAAARGTDQAETHRRAAGRRAQQVTSFPSVQEAFAQRDAGVLSRFASQHPNIAFTLEDGRVVGSIARAAVVQRLPVIAAGGVILTADVPRVSRGVTSGDPAQQLDVPLRTEQGTVSTLRLFSGAEPFDEDARDAAKWIATQAEIALENAHLHRLVQQQALTDDLTSLPNRRRFMSEFRREAQRADRSGTALSVIVLDIDDFKKVNDTWGHETGDAVLRGLAEALAAATRSVDLAARLGGEEFAVLLPNTDAEGAEGVAERIQRDLAAMSTPVRDGTLRVTASFGISSFPDIAPLGELLNDADRCLYEAKRAGKNRIVVSTPAQQ
jgi:diguanylate cyclase (GGDEF)-like protein